MNSWHKMSLISVSLIILFLIFLSGCGPNLKQIKQIKTGMQEQFTVPDNYSMVQDNSKINRPVLVIQHPVKHPTDKGKKKKSAGLIAAEKQMTENNRNYLIRHLFETKAFHQIMPHDDPDDPSLPEDILILEAAQKYVSSSNIADSRNGLMDSKTEQTIIIRDPKTGYSSLTKFDFITFLNQKTDMTEFKYKIDDQEEFKYEIKSSDPDFFNKMFNTTSDALDQIINVVTNKLSKEGY
jgi:hypothetical protein